MGRMVYAKYLLAAGGILILTAAIVFLVSRFGITLGQLPGDITWTRGKSQVHIPLVTCLLVSAFLTIVFNVFYRIFH